MIAEPVVNITIGVKIPVGEIMMLRINMDTIMIKVFRAVATALGMSELSMRFEFDRIRISGEMTARMLGMVQGDQIVCIYEQHFVQPGTFGISIKKPIEFDSQDDSIDLRIKKVTLMKNVFRNVANVLGISESNLWFSIDGERITEVMTASQLELQEGDIIGCELAQTGSSPLIMAAEAGNLETCRFFIDKGIEVDKQKIGIRATALMEASSRGHIEVCQLLLDRGATVDFKRQTDGCTALILASRGGYLSVCQLLIANTAVIDIKDDEGKTSVDYAPVGDCKEYLQRLLAEVIEKRRIAEEAEADEHRRVDLLLSASEVSANRQLAVAAEAHYKLLESNALISEAKHRRLLEEEADQQKNKFRRLDESIAQKPEDCTCIICIDAARVICFVPCGHKAYCKRCFDASTFVRPSECFCGSAVTGTLRVFE